MYVTYYTQMQYNGKQTFWPTMASQEKVERVLCSEDAEVECVRNRVHDPLHVRYFKRVVHQSKDSKDTRTLCQTLASVFVSMFVCQA